MTNVLATGGKFVLAKRYTHRGNSVANNVGILTAHALEGTLIQIFGVFDVG